MKKWLALAALLLLLLGSGWLILDHLTEPRRDRADDPPVAASASNGRGVPGLTGSGAGAGPKATVKLPDQRATGRVVDSSGHGIRGARVLAYRDDLEETVLPVAREDGPIRGTSTAEDGTFTVELDGKAPYFSLLALAEGFPPTSRTDVRPGDDVTIVLPRGGSIHGVVRDLSEKPVAGARVSWLGVVANCRFSPEAISGTDGSYRLDGLPSAASALEVVLEVRALGFATLSMAASRTGLAPGWTGGSNDVTFDIYLGRGATIRGSVVDAESGSPIRGARVVVWSEQEVTGLSRPGGSSSMNPWFARPVGDVVTGNDGAFSIEHVPAWGIHPVGIYTADPTARRLGWIGVVTPGYAIEMRRLEVPSEGEIVEVEFRVPRAGSVRGRVVKLDGAPAAGAKVFWQRTSGLTWNWIPPLFPGIDTSSAVTDPSGLYTVQGVPAAPDGTAAVRVTASPVGASPWAKASSVEVSPRAGAIVEAPDIVLGSADPARLSATVLVVDDGDRPFWGATIEGCIPGGRTDQDGRIRIFFQQDEPMPRSEVVTVNAPGHDPVQSPPIALLAGQTPEVRVSLGRPIVVPAPGAAVSPAPAVPEPPPPSGTTFEGSIRDANTSLPLLKFDVMLAGAGQYLSSTPISPGRFRFSGIPAGTWRLSARAPGYETEVREGIQLGPDVAAPAIDLRLVSGLLLTGRVREATGAALGGSKIILDGQGCPSLMGDVLPDGRFTIHGCRAGGRYAIWLARNDEAAGVAWWVAKPYEDLRLAANATAREVDLVVVPAGALSVIVRSPALPIQGLEGTPKQHEAAAAARITMRTASGDVVAERVGLYPNRRSAVLPVGRWIVRVGIPGSGTAETEAVIEAGKSTEAVIDIP